MLAACSGAFTTTPKPIFINVYSVQMHMRASRRGDFPQPPARHAKANGFVGQSYCLLANGLAAPFTHYKRRGTSFFIVICVGTAAPRFSWLCGRDDAATGRAPAQLAPRMAN